MPRVCCALLAGTLFGVVLVGVVSAALIEFTSLFEHQFHNRI